jgi:hypothetical protein
MKDENRRNPPLGKSALAFSLGLRVIVHKAAVSQIRHLAEDRYATRQLAQSKSLAAFPVLK